MRDFTNGMSKCNILCCGVIIVVYMLFVLSSVGGKVCDLRAGARHKWCSGHVGLSVEI